MPETVARTSAVLTARALTARLAARGIEAVTLAMVVLSPWPFGSVEPKYESWLYAGVAIVLALWGVRMLAQGRITWKKCPVTICLGGLFLVGALQITPMSPRLLAWLQPGTAELYADLLPTTRELPQAESREGVAHPRAGSTLSLYPYATRTELARLFAVFLLFAAIRNNTISSGDALWRLSLAALISGALLAFFGFVQFFSSPNDTFYWQYPRGYGSGFGPFVNRNHFAFHINLCLGLGMGLLLSVKGFRGKSAKLRRSSRPVLRSGDAAPRSLPIARASVYRPYGSLQATDSRFSILSELRSPSALWIYVGLALMVSSLFFCLSRGGLLALLGASAVCALVWTPRSERFLWLRMAIPVGLMAIGLLVWFGLERIEDRMATLWTGEAYEGRIPLWKNVFPLTQEFPLLGTGYGTFQYVERLKRPPIEDVSVCEHAHNEYLEAWIEGGLARLALSLLAIGLVLRGAFRAAYSQNHKANALAIGAAFAFGTILIHSVSEFGLHIPSTALLATVLSAHLCGLGDQQGQGAVTEPGGADSSLGSKSGFALSLMPTFTALVGAGLAVMLGLALYGEGRRAAQVDWLQQLVAIELPVDDEPRDLAFQVAALSEASRLAPLNAELHLELARAYAETSALTPAPAMYQDLSLGNEGREAEWIRALTHLLRARDLCPLLPDPHVWIGVYSDLLPRSDARVRYLRRAKRLSPSDAELWYLCGAQEIADNQLDQAWGSWRRSLQLSSRYLEPILARSADFLRPEEILTRVLPNEPRLWLEAANRLFKEDARRRPEFFQMAAELTKSQPGKGDPGDLHAQALIHYELGQLDESVTAYEAALLKEPQRFEWRYELAKLYHELGELKAARRELLLVLGQQRDHAGAQALLDTVARAMAVQMVEERF